MTEKQENMIDVDAIILIPAKRKEVEPDISDLYPPTIFKRPCSNCANEDSINICDQCCFNYDSWFRKKKEATNDFN